MAYVHGTGNAVLRRNDLIIISCFQEFREFVILIRSNDEAFNRQSHLHGQHTTHHIAEISGRNRKDDLFIGCLPQLRISIEIINDLWYYPANIN